ncbi:FeoB-associated Cys-rich membrane protein [Abyssalbus ytuae]|uniref:FeoB-associated Cys-rich membrane protein n=1 Tax=Abyssalbus ytuae TaxID=2926907 RepID=A0A9E7CSB2_9FLAO|nr:FeoB-associated Cys-rich membrane protein [Abyssalbus ytuae]UOB15971.1 FeoB-associated Cys-rich membrane protein [Abyssalbus ytuae]
MITLQHILVYITVLLALVFLIKKFLLPKKKTSKTCGKDDCGCH